MKHFLLDTNVLVRFLVGDQPAQKKEVEDWFRDAENGKINLIVPSIIIAETSFVLESYYKLERNKIATALELFVSQRWLKVEERIALQKLWQFYRQGFHFVDSYLLAFAHTQAISVLTFDKNLKKFL